MNEPKIEPIQYRDAGVAEFEAQLEKTEQEIKLRTAQALMADIASDIEIFLGALRQALHTRRSLRAQLQKHLELYAVPAGRVAAE